VKLPGNQAQQFISLQQLLLLLRCTAATPTLWLSCCGLSTASVVVAGYGCSVSVA
jgi:hypothetical protein